ncbi:unnamed protein product [Closterium sp. NIES-53]
MLLLLLLLPAAAAERGYYCKTPCFYYWCCHTRCCAVPCQAALPSLRRIALPSRAAFLELRCRAPTEPHCRAATAAVSAVATAPIAATATMATFFVLSFDVEGHAITFDIWLDDLQLFLQSEARDGVPLFAHTNESLPAPPARDSRSFEALIRDATARLAVRNHLHVAERAHFSQQKIAKALYDAVVARYSSPATAALGRLMLPYLHPKLADFHTISDLFTHLRSSEARYRAALKPTFLAAKPPPPPLYITLYILVTRCAPSPLLPLVAIAVAVDLVGAASTPSGRCNNSKGKGGKGGGGSTSGGGGGGGGGGDGGGGGGSGSGGSGDGRGGGGGGGGGGDWCGGGSGGRGGGRGGAGKGGGRGASAHGGGGFRSGQQLPRLLDNPTPQQLREWVVQRGSSGGSGRCPYLSDEDACYSCVPGDAGVVAIALGASESGAALSASASAVTGASASAVIGASEFAASAEALHTFALDSGASRCFFHDCTTLTPLAAPVLVSLANPSWGPVVARASTVLPCLAVPSGSLSGLHLPSFSTNLVSNAAFQDVWVDTFTPGGQRVAICTCSRDGRHLATFTRRPGSSLYTLTTASAQVAESGQVAAPSWVSASGEPAVSCSCRVLSHQTLLWHHRLGHPSIPRVRGMHSCLLVSLPCSRASPCLPCVEGRQRAALHSSEFPPTTAPLQTLHMDV